MDDADCHARLKAKAPRPGGSGDYAKIADLIRPVSRALVDACAISAGQEVLDVAAGNGNLAVVAARGGRQRRGLRLLRPPRWSGAARDRGRRPRRRVGRGGRRGAAVRGRSLRLRGVASSARCSPRVRAKVAEEMFRVVQAGRHGRAWRLGPVWRPGRDVRVHERTASPADPRGRPRTRASGASRRSSRSGSRRYASSRSSWHAWSRAALGDAGVGFQQAMETIGARRRQPRRSRGHARSSGAPWPARGPCADGARQQATGGSSWSSRSTCRSSRASAASSDRPAAASSTTARRSPAGRAQPGLRTVQAELEAALGRVLRRARRAHGRRPHRRRRARARPGGEPRRASPRLRTR